MKNTKFVQSVVVQTLSESKERLVPMVLEIIYRLVGVICQRY